MIENSHLFDLCTSFIVLTSPIRGYEINLRNHRSSASITLSVLYDVWIHMGLSCLYQVLTQFFTFLFSLPCLQVASEAIKSFLSAIQSIVLQQEEELTLRKKTDKIEKKLQRELSSLSEMEMKLEGNFNLEDGNSLLTPKHPLTLKRAKVEALKKRVNEEKAKYLNSIRVTRAMTLNNLRTSLPHVFQALMGFSSAYTQSLEAILSRPEPVDCDAEFSPIR